ncbi:hypothetical protein E2562_011674 [Oryza meyeriana var. granulata]|uniref:Uncharacterized protein n=1 Tax=Oryza meyeriana var. granulata TaxID=110450 RepID=A0A6G1DHJ9_9ORYZ|nr:hypothetical protein E2562_011674 [Oryza meyeriana var. granulata]
MFGVHLASLESFGLSRFFLRKSGINFWGKDKENVTGVIISEVTPTFDHISLAAQERSSPAATFRKTLY